MYAWSSQDPVCALKSSPALVRGGSASAIFKQPIAGLLAGCGRCSRLSCLVTFQLQDARGPQGPLNYLFLSSPKDALCLQAPNITVSALTMTLTLTLTKKNYVWSDYLQLIKCKALVLTSRDSIIFLSCSLSLFLTLSSILSLPPSLSRSLLVSLSASFSCVVLL